MKGIYLEDPKLQTVDQRQAEIASHVEAILEIIGEDPEREGLLRTPQRVTRMLAEITSGIGRDPAEALSVEFHETYDGVVAIRRIPFYSLCEHHLLPFFGRVDIAYQPANGVLTGLSKLARLVEVASRRPQVQERLTKQIADAIEARLHPQGVWVRVEAEHLCMAMRGVSKTGTKTITWWAAGTLKPTSPLQGALVDFGGEEDLE